MLLAPYFFRCPVALRLGLVQSTPLLYPLTTSGMVYAVKKKPQRTEENNACCFISWRKHPHRQERVRYW